MFKKFSKGVLSLFLVIMMGVLTIIEIAIEVLYQIVRLIRRGYKYLTNVILRKIEPVYKNKMELKTCKDVETEDDITYYKIIY